VQNWTSGELAFAFHWLLAVNVCVSVQQYFLRCLILSLNSQRRNMKEFRLSAAMLALRRDSGRMCGDGREVTRCLWQHSQQVLNDLRIKNQKATSSSSP
jgi:hypothetical protein